METGKNKKGIVYNSFYTIGAALIMNGILQLVVYPVLNRVMGSSQLGEMLFFQGLIAIVAPSVGQALNSGHLVVRRELDVVNGDYNVLNTIFAGIGTLLILLSAQDIINSMGEVVLAIALIMATTFRYYGDVEYRLSLNYKQYLYYYILLTAGYLVGLFTYRWHESWLLLFLCGETCAIAYVIVKGTIFKEFFKRSPYFGLALKRGFVLMVSYLIMNLAFNIERILLKGLLGDEAVSLYYVASLVGKTFFLLVVPINTLLISYLTKSSEEVNRKKFLKLSLIGIGVASGFIIMAEVASPLFIKIFYSDLYENVRGILTIVNVSQVAAILSAYLFIVLLLFAKEKWQLILQIVYLVVLVILGVGFTRQEGIRGFAIATLIANVFRICLVMGVGFILSNSSRR